MTATIRDATAADAPAIAAIWNPVIRDTLATFNSVEKTPDEIARLIAARASEGRAFFVADGPDGLLGFATYFQFRGGVGYAHTMEHTIILTPAARGTGLGRRMMAVVEDHARRAGAHSLIAGVVADNAAGRAFHAALGYCETTILPEVGRKNGRWLDLVLMQKLL